MAKREFDVEGFEIILQRDQFLARRRFMDTINKRRFLAFQRLCRGHIGGNHEILDHLMRIEMGAHSNADHPALIIKRDPPFGHINAKWIATVACLFEKRPAGPKRLESTFEHWVIQCSIDRRLRIFIRNIGRNAGDCARETP